MNKLDKERKRNNKISKRLDDVGDIIESLKVDVEKSNKINEELEAQLLTKVKNYNNLEEEIVKLHM